MNAHDTPSGTRMMCIASVNAIWARAHGTGLTATRASAANRMAMSGRLGRSVRSFSITGSAGRMPLLAQPLDLAAVRRQRPDHGDRGHDDRDAPDRIPRQPRERGDPTDDRHDHADRPRPHRAGEDAEAGEHDDDPDKQMDPSPRRAVELEDVVRRLRVEGVVEDADQTGDGVERSEQDHHEPCERDPPGRPGTALTLRHRVPPPVVASLSHVWLNPAGEDPARGGASFSWSTTSPRSSSSASARS